MFSFLFHMHSTLHGGWVDWWMDGWMDGVVVHIVLLLLTISFVENNSNHVCQQYTKTTKMTDYIVHFHPSSVVCLKILWVVYFFFEQLCCKSSNYPCTRYNIACIDHHRHRQHTGIIYQIPKENKTWVWSGNRGSTYTPSPSFRILLRHEKIPPPTTPPPPPPPLPLP